MRRGSKTKTLDPARLAALRHSYWSIAARSWWTGSTRPPTKCALARRCARSSDAPERRRTGRAPSRPCRIGALGRERARVLGDELGQEIVAEAGVHRVARGRSARWGRATWLPTRARTPRPWPAARSCARRCRPSCVDLLARGAALELGAHGRRHPRAQGLRARACFTVCLSDWRRASSSCTRSRQPSQCSTCDSTSSCFSGSSSPSENAPSRVRVVATASGGHAAPRFLAR